jgi:hypothetical protein
MEPTWYGFTPDLGPREDGPVTLKDALARAGRVIANLQPHYERAEDALAATFFGLSLAKGYFLEFSVNRRDSILMHFELPGAPWYRRLFRNTANWRTLNSTHQVSQAIEHFFTLAPSELRTILEEMGAA